MQRGISEPGGFAPPAPPTPSLAGAPCPAPLRRSAPMARLILLALLLVCSVRSMRAQAAKQDRPPSFRTGVELVTVDVGVVDRQGQPLLGLAPADFTVTVAGQPRRVVTAEFVDTTPPKSASAAQPVAISTNEGGGVGRLFVFVVDQSTLEPGNVRYVANAAARFFDGLTFADRSALMLLPVGQSIGFTWAHDRVKQALQHVTGLGARPMLWEYGSLSEAREIADRNVLTLRTVGDRECRGSSVSAANAGGGSSIPTPVAPPTGGGGGGGGAAGGGGGTGGGAGGSGASGSGGGGGGAVTVRGSSPFGMDACTRDVQMQAESAWREAQMTSLASISALRQLLINLSRVNGDKTVILISGGWPLEERDETSLLSTVAQDAAAARATLYTLFVPATMFSADRRGMTSTPARDQFLHVGPLETLAGMTGGGSFRAEVNPQAAFERIGRELAGYYRLGVEKDPSDHDGKGRRLKIQVARGGVTVRARDIFDIRTYEDRDWAARLASALESPVPATGLGLRVTSYIATDSDERGRFKLVIAGEASRIEKGEATFQVLVRDLDGKKIVAGEQSLGEATSDVLPFASNIPLPAGSYIVRAAVMDAAGRVGSVDHRVEVKPIALGEVEATGPLLIRIPPRGGGEPRFALDGISQDERLALEVDLEADASRLTGADVAFEVSSAADGPALVSAAGNLMPGTREGSTIAQGFAEMRMLPPGSYIARAKISAGGQSIGEVQRAFTVRAAAAPAIASADEPTVVAPTVTTPPLTARALGAAPRFAIEQVLAPQVLNGFLDRIAARPDASSAGVRELLAQARNANLGELKVPDTVESAPLAFLKGLSLLAQRQLDPAADAFRTAMRAASDFYPAMIYLGACYAAGGNDKEASGAWRTALIREADTLPLHVLLTDALLRQGDGDLALETVEDARARWPEDQGLKRRFVVAALLAGRYMDGLQVAEELLDRNAADEPTLALATLTLYEAFQNHRPIQTVDDDRARMTRFAAAYRAQGGPSVALIDTWMAAVAKK